MSVVLDWNKYSVAGEGVIPGWGNELEVTASTTALQVFVNTGAAIFNAVYINDASVTLAIGAPGANSRIDAVVLDWDGSTVTAAIVAGTGAANPTVPALAANEFLLAYVYVPAGSTMLNAAWALDRREFVQNGYTTKYAHPQNLIKNSEMLVWSDLTKPPDGWQFFGAPATFNLNTTGGQIYHRERSLYMRGNGAVGYTQDVFVPQTENTDRLVTVRFQVRCGANGGGFAVYLDGTLAQTRALMPSGEVYEIVLKHTVAASATSFNLDIRPLGTTVDMYFGQVLCAIGHYTGVYRPIHEIIMLDNAVDDTTFDGSVNYSTSTNTHSLNSEWTSKLNYKIYGIICQLGVRDSGSAAGTAHVAIRHPSASDYVAKLECSGIVNDEWVYDTVIFPVNFQHLTQHFTVVITATGAGTLNLILRPIGVIT